MEGGEVEQFAPPPSLTKLCENLCPFFMSIGMSYDEFWNGDSDLTFYYLRAYNLSQDRLNRQAYLQGFYFHEAALLAIGNALRDKKDVYRPYLQTVDVLPLTKEQFDELQAELERREYETMKSKLKTMIKK